jgi:hypothetical protein
MIEFLLCIAVVWAAVHFLDWSLPTIPDVSHASVSPLWLVLLYLVPLVFCLVFYTVRTVKNCRRDIATRARHNPKEGEYYCPTDTIGTLVGRALVSILPVANIWAAMFDLAPAVFGKLFKSLGKLFNQPLVPRQPKKSPEAE